MGGNPLLKRKEKINSIHVLTRKIITVIQSGAKTPSVTVSGWGRVATVEGSGGSALLCRRVLLNFSLRKKMFPEGFSSSDRRQLDSFISTTVKSTESAKPSRQRPPMIQME